MAEDKSVLDNIPVVENRVHKGCEEAKSNGPALGIVGNCPHCGAPIYGHRVLVSQNKPRVEYSCTCRPGGFREQTRTT